MTEYRSIAALGSSYAAGPNIKPIVNRAAMRSGNNYAHVLARSIGADLTDLTVSGATTPTILDTPQRVGLVKFAPQLASLPADTDLVLVTAAGNDLGYLGSAIKLAAYFILDKYTRGQLRRWKPPRLPVTTDTTGAGVQWSETANADDWPKNLIRRPVRTQFRTSVYRPLGVVVGDMNP
ncbi:GDSL-type esterase/lipase family protein [Mycobacterium sp. 852002-51057_SCH5723018]|uniref:GDSL-type esterase/lipase family protein n=1 Tax=Mycobacterium sp. 852002-51057_SCH5723018 TaxID=1834094 RepID=UPI000800F796|nr:GDSL-type esterase/lipase family protein [Mycobacterium sp. 852002-51057_SCH5723018]OBG19711.1 hypothetical protein A5764_16155 [Mycobacterium sp. 852002-51057_SCH5723018]